MPKVSESYLEAKRQQLLDAAITCFARNGFSETTIEDICREAGVSHGALYRHFKSKEDIIEASYWRDRETMTTRFAAAKKKGDTRRIMEELFELYIHRRDQSDPQTQMKLKFRVQLYAEAARNPSIRETQVKSWEDFLESFGGIVRGAQERGEITPVLDSEMVTRVLMALVIGFNVQKTIDPSMDVAGYAKASIDVLMGNLWLTREDGGDVGR